MRRRLDPGWRLDDDQRDQLAEWLYERLRERQPPWFRDWLAFRCEELCEMMRVEHERLKMLDAEVVLRDDS